MPAKPLSLGRSSLERLQARYNGRYRYHWSRLLFFAALDGATRMRNAECGMRNRGQRSEGAIRPHSAFRIPHSAFQRILLIRVDGIGDVVNMLPALDALRGHLPEAEIDLLTSPPGAELMEGDPRLDRVMRTRFLYLDAKRGQNRVTPDLRAWRATIRELRARRYDLAIDFRGDFRTIFWLTRASGAACRLSWSNVSAGRHLLTDSLDCSPGLHEAEAGLRLVSLLGAEPVSRFPRLHLSPALVTAAEDRLRAEGAAPGRPRVGFHCFAASPLRTWPAERFAALIDALARETGARGVLLGSEVAPAQALLASTRSHPVSLVGRTSLKELAAVISRLDLLVAVDSGLGHLAAAVGTPTVSLFGPTDPIRWRPMSPELTLIRRELPCSPCRDRDCPYPVNRCMQEIEVEEVLAAARRHLRIRTFEVVGGLFR